MRACSLRTRGPKPQRSWASWALAWSEMEGGGVMVMTGDMGLRSGAEERGRTGTGGRECRQPGSRANGITLTFQRSFKLANSSHVRHGRSLSWSPSNPHRWCGGLLLPAPGPGGPAQRRWSVARVDRGAPSLPGRHRPDLVPPVGPCGGPGPGPGRGGGGHPQLRRAHLAVAALRGEHQRGCHPHGLAGGRGDGSAAACPLGCPCVTERAARPGPGWPAGSPAGGRPPLRSRWPRATPGTAP